MNAYFQAFGSSWNSSWSQKTEKAAAFRLEPSENILFASAVAEFGLLLRDSEYKGNANYGQLLSRAKQSKGSDTEGYRAEFIRLVEKAQLLGEK